MRSPRQAWAIVGPGGVDFYFKKSEALQDLPHSVESSRVVGPYVLHPQPLVMKTDATETKRLRRGIARILETIEDNPEELREMLRKLLGGEK